MNFGNSILHLILLSFNSSFKDALVVFKDYNELHYTMLTLLQIEAPLPVLCKLTVGEAGYRHILRPFSILILLQLVTLKRYLYILCKE